MPGLFVPTTNRHWRLVFTTKTREADPLIDRHLRADPETGHLQMKGAVARAQIGRALDQDRGQKLAAKLGDFVGPLVIATPNLCVESAPHKHRAAVPPRPAHARVFSVSIDVQPRAPAKFV